jgi:uncharacterized protein (TIGR02246 family)
MRTWLILIAAFAAQPVLAHPGAEHGTVVESEATAVTNVLAAYKTALERLDASGTEQLFTADSAIFESGGSEGTYSNYLAHHLSPELKEFKSFTFSNYQISVRFEGPLALVTESYTYRIVTKTGETAERLGVATSILKKIGGRWKILSMHNSSRRPAAH